MIYKKDGKLLVKDGKLCSSCCPENSMESECEFCVDTQPAWIDITLSNFIDCLCYCGAEYCAYTYGFAAAVNNKTFRVLHSSGCIYSTYFPGNFGANRHYDAGTNCTGDYLEGISNYLLIQLILTATGVDILVRPQGLLGNWHHLFTGTITYTGDDSCGNTENVANNTIPACLYTFWLDSLCGNTGQARISL